MGKKYPEWLESFFDASRGNAKYDSAGVVDADADTDKDGEVVILDDVFSPTRSRADKENLSNDNTPPALRRGKVTKAVFEAGVALLEAGANQRAQLQREDNKAQTGDRVILHFTMAQEQLLGSVAAFQAILAENNKK